MRKALKGLVLTLAACVAASSALASDCASKIGKDAPNFFTAILFCLQELEKENNALKETIAKVGTAELAERMAKDAAALTKKITTVEENIKHITTQLNEMNDGFWIPITTSLLEINSGKEFELPVSRQDDVSMKILMEPNVEDLVSKHLQVQIGGKPLGDVSQYINRGPFKIEAKLFKEKEEAKNHDFRLSFNEEFTSTFAQRIAKFRENFNNTPETISVLMVVHRPVLLKASEENVPEPGE